MQTCTTCRKPGCPVRLPRRRFLASAGALAAAAEIGLVDFARSLFAAEPSTAERPVVRAAFLGPKGDRYWMGWPGTSYDIPARQADYTKVMSEAAAELGVDLRVDAERVSDETAVAKLLDECKQSPPDGVVLTVMGLAPNYWPHAAQFANGRGDIPTIVFSPMGTSFLHHIQAFPDVSRTFVASTHDVGWLAFGLRMLNTIWRMKHTRICIVQGENTEDRLLEAIGTTLHYIPHTRFAEEFGKVGDSEEARAIADYYVKGAKQLIEPTEQDVFEAAKTYVVCRRLMDAEDCQGIAVDCLPLVSRRQVPPPCLAFSRLRDEGVVGSCQADWPAAISSRLTHLLLDRPGFMQNICVDTVGNTLMGAHCTCATRLDGFDKPPEPFILRSHAESDLGVATQVLWRIGQRITIMKFSDAAWWGKPPSESAESLASAIVLGAGRVVRNIDTPPSGGCRTSLEVAVDDVNDIRKLRALHHQLFIYGDHTRQFKAYAQLAGIQVEPI